MRDIRVGCVPERRSWYDGSDKLRARVPPLRFGRLVKAAFDQIRQAAAENPAVLIRILDTIR
jgi:uncharacterized membrane protein